MSGRPRLAFLGLGWIGRHRLEAIHHAGRAGIAMLCDPSTDAVASASALVPAAMTGTTMDDILARADDLDGVVIASPSALHASQSIAALEAGLAVFCQKPLGRNAPETRAVVAAARAADRLLAVDLSYRHTAAMQAIRPLLQQGDLGEIFAVDLTFHNAYGPDKPWFYDARLSGGGCVIDLGVHLVDLALWCLDGQRVTGVTAQLFAGGRPLPHRTGDDAAAVEDFAAVTLTLEKGTVVRLACSWKLPAGRDAVIGAAFYGTGGGAAMRNLGGSFYDFTAERFDGTAAQALASPPDDWGGRAATDWAARLADGAGFDPDCERLVTLAEVLDRIYAGGVDVREQARPGTVD
ncbi:Gfo/Idh/MocA family protein [Halodurantibacterium flavum]|uniref:Gfo/Idh/MocA family protein n=1 Tax=Halodurantibacterium flavum TaxID=1382802 RepID=A0ABW4S5S0_9RHOB